MAVISRTYSKILAVLMAWLGYSCNKTVDDIGCEYGTPSATFKAKGVVVSQADNTPIEGIRAVLKPQSEIAWGIDTVYTDNKGVFYLKNSSHDYFNKLYVELTDVDGDKNGSFVGKDVEVDFSHVNFKGSNSEVEKDLGIIILESKK